MNLPEAQVTHRGRTRLRVRIPSRRGDRAYFEKIAEAFAGFPEALRVESNPETAGVLFQTDALDPVAIERFATGRGLFMVPAERRRPPPGLPNRSVEPLKAFDRGVRAATGGRLNLAGALFYSLVGSAAYQIFQGRFSAPPWYTAFWYAFGVYTKQLAEGGGEAEGAD